MERRAVSSKEAHKTTSPNSNVHPKSWCIGRVNSQPDKQGWLYKRERRNRKAWKKRWFILHFNALAYFDRQGAREVRGIIPLEDAVIEEDSDAITGFRFSIGLFTVGKDFFIRGVNETEILSWLVSINKSITLYKSAAISSPKNTKQQRKLWIANLKENFRVHSLLQMNGELEAVPRIQIFGVELEEVLKNDGERNIPFICEKMFQYVENKGLNVSGIFRVSGDQEETNQLREAFELGENVDLYAIENVHSVAGLLKLFFRELPNPLATYDLFNEFLAVASIQVERDRLKGLQIVVDKLPKPNWYLMKELFTMLSHITEFSDVNQMTSSNLAIVFAPTIFRQNTDDPLASLQYTPFTISVAKFLIEHFNQIFRIENSNPRRSTIVSQSFLLPLKYLPDEKEIEELKKIPQNENKNNNNANNPIGMTTEELFELFRSQYQNANKTNNNNMVAKVPPAVPMKVKPPRPPRGEVTLRPKVNNNLVKKENNNLAVPLMKPIRTSPITQSDNSYPLPTPLELNHLPLPSQPHQITQDDNSEKFAQFKKRPTPPARHVHNSDSVVEMEMDHTRGAPRVVPRNKENVNVKIDKPSISQLQREIHSFNTTVEHKEVTREKSKEDEEIDEDDEDDDESHNTDDSDLEDSIKDDGNFDQSVITETENQITDCLQMANFLLNELYHDNISIVLPKKKTNFHSLIENADVFLNNIGR